MMLADHQTGEPFKSLFGPSALWSGKSSRSHARSAMWSGRFSRSWPALADHCIHRVSHRPLTRSPLFLTRSSLSLTYDRVHHRLSLADDEADHRDREPFKILGTRSAKSSANLADDIADHAPISAHFGPKLGDFHSFFSITSSPTKNTPLMVI